MAKFKETCHSRWCPIMVSEFNDVDNFDSLCSNVTTTFEALFNILQGVSLDDWPSSYKSSRACCRLWCNKPSNQLLQLQCQNTSETMAFLTWVMVIVLVLCAIIQLVSVSLERGARKVAMVGGPLFLAFISVIVYLVTSHNDEVDVDTPFYPIVGAMNVAAFSYFFSSFQYSISLAHELTSATALIFSMFPIWTILTVKMKKLIQLEQFQNLATGQPSHDEVDFNRMIESKIRKVAGLVLVLLLLSLLWVIHSSIYRTVEYRAAWVTAFNKQLAERCTPSPHKNYMSRLWVLAGAQGHPTWRTPVGQSIGLCLAVLSWCIPVIVHTTVKSICYEDLILFHILLWVPPVILTLGVLTNQFTICVRASYDISENGDLISRWFKAGFPYLWEAYDHMEDAVITYRLGRDSLEVENSNAKYKLEFCDGRIQWIDKFVAIVVFYTEALLLGITYPTYLLLQIFQWLLISCVLKCTPTSSSARATSEVSMNPELVPSRLSSMCPTFDCFSRRCSLELSLNEKIQAYRILCEYCVNDVTGEHYQDSAKNCHKLTEKAIHEDIRKIFSGYRRNIRLSLLLDNIGPSRMSYLLQELTFVLMNELREPRDTEMNAVLSDQNEAIQGLYLSPAIREADTEVLVQPEAIQEYIVTDGSESNEKTPFIPTPNDPVQGPRVPVISRRQTSRF